MNHYLLHLCGILKNKKERIASCVLIWLKDDGNLTSHINMMITKLIMHIYAMINFVKLKTNDIVVGKRCLILGPVRIFKEKKSTAVIGDNFTFTSGMSINPLSRNIRGLIYLNKGAKLSIGDNVGISSASIWVHSSVKIGNNVKIGSDCLIVDSDCHSLNYILRRSASMDASNKIDVPIVIEDDVLIGARCIILKGCTIGAHSIIGAGSVVTKDVPSNVIASGNPCRVIKELKFNNA